MILNNFITLDDGKLTATTLPFIVCGTPNHVATNLITVVEEVSFFKEKDCGDIYCKQKPAQLYD